MHLHTLTKSSLVRVRSRVDDSEMITDTREKQTTRQARTDEESSPPLAKVAVAIAATQTDIGVLQRVKLSVKLFPVKLLSPVKLLLQEIFGG